MYFGWNFCGKVLRSNEWKIFWTGFSRAKRSAICLRIESLMIKLEGEKLNAAPGAVGAGLLQFTAQQSWAALMVLASQSFVFLLQQSIADIPFSVLPENAGVPASTPAASAKNRKSDVNHFFIYTITVLNRLKFCQEWDVRKAYFYSFARCNWKIFPIP